MTQYRIVKLNNDKYALEKKISIFGFSFFGWSFVCHPHPDCSNLVETFNTVEEAKQYFFNPMKVVYVVGEIVPPK